MASCDNDPIMTAAVTTVVLRPGDVFSPQLDTATSTSYQYHFYYYNYYYYYYYYYYHFY